MSKLSCMSMGSVIAALTLVFASLYVAAPAVAKGGGHGGHSAPMAMSSKPSGSSKPHIHWRTYAPSVVVVPTATCGEYLSLWRRTGNPYWRTKYYVCIG